MNPPLQGKIKKYAKIKRLKAKSNCIKNPIYIDDGISGTTFEREGLQAMLAEVEKGNIGTIIVKDMSRLGRNYVQMGILKYPMRKLDTLVADFPDIYKLIEQDEVSKAYSFPKSYIS